MDTKNQELKDSTKPDDRVRRRKLLGSLAVGAGIIGAGALGSTDTYATENTQGECLDSAAGPTADRFPQHVYVYDQFGRKLRFYHDLIKGKVVMLQFMSTATEGDLQTAANLTRVQDLMGEAMGRDVFLYSMTIDPINDTPAVLADYAKRHCAGRGWLFLTGLVEHMASIRDALHFRPGGHNNHSDDQDCSMGLIRYGNETAGLWGAVPTRTEPAWIAERLKWMLTTNNHQQQPRRRGPPVRV